MDSGETRDAVRAAYSKAKIIRTMRNARTQHEAAVAAEVVATR